MLLLLLTGASTVAVVATPNRGNIVSGMASVQQEIRALDGPTRVVNVDIAVVETVCTVEVR